jgi:small conductance mechanosensitive channel
MPGLDKILDKLSQWLEHAVVMLPNLALAAFVMLCAIPTGRLAQLVAERLLRRVTGHDAISHMLAVTIRVALVVAAGLVSLSLLNLDKAVTSLLAGVGVVGLALGFAFQDIAANFMSGVMMALNRPFQVGDFVSVGGHQGRIVGVSFRATSIETSDGLAVLIPNRDVFQNPIVNYTKTPLRRLELKVGTAYRDDMEVVRRVTREAALATPCRCVDRDVEVLFEEFGDSSINFSVLVWLDRSDQMTLRKARSELMIAIKRAFDREKLTIPFPIRTLDFGAGVVGGVRLDAMKLGSATGTERERA